MTTLHSIMPSKWLKTWLIQMKPLLIKTDEHSHVLTLGGYSFRGQHLFDINKGHEGDPSLDKFNKTYTHLGYANCRGGLQSMRTKNLNDEQTSKRFFDFCVFGHFHKMIFWSGMFVVVKKRKVILKRQPFICQRRRMKERMCPFKRVGQFLFDGTVEESFIAHVMAYSAWWYFNKPILTWTLFLIIIVFNLLALDHIMKVCTAIARANGAFIPCYQKWT